MFIKFEKRFNFRFKLHKEKSNKFFKRSLNSEHVFISSHHVNQRILDL